MELGLACTDAVQVATPCEPALIRKVGWCHPSPRSQRGSHEFPALTAGIACVVGNVYQIVRWKRRAFKFKSWHGLFSND